MNRPIAQSQIWGALRHGKSEQLPECGQKAERSRVELFCFVCQFGVFISFAILSMYCRSYSKCLLGCSVTIVAWLTVSEINQRRKKQSELRAVLVVFLNAPMLMGKNPEISFHDFPSNNSLLGKWLQAIRRDIGPTFQITESTKVCGAHFLPTDYTPPTKRALKRRETEGKGGRPKKL